MVLYFLVEMVGLRDLHLFGVKLPLSLWSIRKIRRKEEAKNGTETC